MSVQENKALVQRYFDEVWNEGNLAAADEIFASDYVDPSAPPRVPRGPEGAKDFVVVNRARFPDIQYTVNDLIGEGDKVVAEWSAQGTNSGSLSTRSGRSLPPTGKRVEWHGTSIFRILAGKITEQRISPELLGVFRELGLVVDAA